MNLLLDTHIALWWFADSPRVTTPVHEAVRDADRVVVSVASVWEIMIKQVLGKLDAPVNILHALNKSAFGTLPIEVAHAVTAGCLPPHHRDPFDRMLVAQAQCEDLTLVSADPWVAKDDVTVLSTS